MARRYSFPILKKDEICKNLAELGAPKLSLDNLISPSSDAIIPVYDYLSSFLSTFVQTSDLGEELLQPDFVALGDNYELHSESHATLGSLHSLRKFMEAAGAEDFSAFRDLLRPESQRTIAFLSAAINYIRHSNSKGAFLKEVFQKRQGSIADLEKINEEKLKIESEIAQIEQERATEQPQVEALELEIKELNNKLQSLNKQHHGMTLDINTLKQEDASVLDKISSLDFEIMQKQQEGAHIRSQVVENPKELQKLLQEKKSALAEEEGLGRNAVESCEAWKAKVEVISKAENKFLKLQRMLQTVEEQVNDRNADKVLKERKARLKALEKEEWSCDAKSDEFKWAAQRSKERLEKCQKQCEERSKDLQALKAGQEQQRVDHSARLQAVQDREKQEEALQRKNGEILAREESERLRFRSFVIKWIEEVGKLDVQAA